MAIIQSSTFTAIDAQDLRSKAKTKTSILEDIVEQQAFVYETLTGEKVPEASSISATPHDHQGTDGEVIKHALFCDELNIRVTASGGASQDTFYDLVYFCFYAPPGITSIDLYVGITSNSQQKRTDFTWYSGATTPSTRSAVRGELVKHEEAQENFPGKAPFGPYLKVTIDVNADSPNAILMRCAPYGGSSGAVSWDFEYTFAFALAEGYRNSVGYRYYPPDTTNTNTIVPDSTEHLGAHEFTSFDEELVAHDRGYTAYHLKKCSKNNALCFEVLTGMPAGMNASGHSNNASYDGHNHKEDPSTALDDSGDRLLHQLSRGNFGGAIADYDAAGYKMPDLRGFTYVGASTSAYEKVAAPYFKIPAFTDANVTSSTRIYLKALVFSDPGKSAEATLEVYIEKVSSANAVLSTSSTHTFSAASPGLQWIGGAISLSSWSASPKVGDGCDARVHISLGKLNNSDDPFLFGFVLYTQ